MKKLCTVLAMVLCIAMLTTSVFAADAGAYSLYSSAMKKMEQVTSAKIKGTMKITMESDIVSMDMKLGFTMTQRINSRGELEMAMVMDDNDFGVNTASYYKDGYFYSNANGVKTKVKMAQESAMADLSGGLSKELFQSATVEEVENGQRIKLKIPSKYMDEVMGTTLNNIADSSVPGSDAKLSSITCYFTIDDDGRLKTQQMNYTMTLSGDVAMKAKYSIVMKYSSLNNVSKIDFPSDLSSYKAA